MLINFVFLEMFIEEIQLIELTILYFIKWKLLKYSKKKQKMKEKKKEAQKEETTKDISTVICTTPTPKEESEESVSIKEEMGPAETKSSPSRGTIESDTTSLGAAEMDSGDCTPTGVLLQENERDDINYGQPPIDLVLYLQQTGSIIALAKLLDSLYDSEYEDEVIGGDANREGQQKTIDLNVRDQTAQ